MIIPHDKLSPDALTGLIEEFVSRNGTDDGHIDQTLQERCDQVCQQLKNGKAIIVYDDHTKSANIVLKESLKNV